MKIITLLALLSSTPAFAAPKLYTIDMTGKRFVSNGFNKMDDGIVDTDGFQIKLEGELHRDFEISAQHSERKDENCGFGKIRTAGRFSFVEITSNLDTDSGETCDYTIRYLDGREATLSVEETGT